MRGGRSGHAATISRSAARSCVRRGKLSHEVLGRVSPESGDTQSTVARRVCRKAANGSTPAPFGPAMMKRFGMRGGSVGGQIWGKRVLSPQTRLRVGRCFSTTRPTPCSQLVRAPHRAGRPDGTTHEAKPEWRALSPPHHSDSDFGIACKQAPACEGCPGSAQHAALAGVAHQLAVAGEPAGERQLDGLPRRATLGELGGIDQDIDTATRKVDP